jgi:hypothetical protein
MIEKYTFGSVRIDGNTYHTDVIVYPERIDHHWWRHEGHHLCLEDLQEIVRRHPDTLIVGTGYLGRMQIDPQLSDTLQKQGIALIVKPTIEACSLYNELKASRDIVAALHLTC